MEVDMQALNCAAVEKNPVQGAVISMPASHCITHAYACNTASFMPAAHSFICLQYIALSITQGIIHAIEKKKKNKKKNKSSQLQLSEWLTYEREHIEISRSRLQLLYDSSIN